MAFVSRCVHWGLLAAAFACAGAISANAQNEAVPIAELKPAQQVRALYVTAPGPAVMEEPVADRMIRQAREARFNTLFVQVRVLGDAYYRSNTEPRASGLTPLFADPLRTILNNAHNPPQAQESILRPSEPKAAPQPLKVFAVLEMLRAHSRRISTNPQPLSVLARAPSWVTLDYVNKAIDADDYLTLEPALPEVREYLAGVVRELLMRYELDGIVLEGLRYPEENGSWGYHPQVLNEFYQEYPQAAGRRPRPDDPAWINFRKDRMRTLVETLVRVAHETRPSTQVFVSAEVFNPPPYSMEDWGYHPVPNGMMQDWVAWGRDAIVDGILLKNLQREYTEATDFRGWLAFARRAQLQVPIYMGVHGSVNFNIGISNQVLLTQAAQLAGVVLYDYHKPTAEDRQFLFSRLRSAIFTDEPTSVQLLSLAELDRMARRPVRTQEAPTTPTLALLAPTTDTLALLAATTDTLALDAATTATAIPTPLRTPWISTRRVVATPTPEPTPAPTLILPTPTRSALLMTATPAPPQYQTFRLKDGRIFRARILVQSDELVTLETETGARLKLFKNRIESPSLE